MEKFKVIRVKPGSFQFNGIMYDHNHLTDEEAQKLIGEGYENLEKIPDKKPSQKTES